MHYLESLSIYEKFSGLTKKRLKNFKILMFGQILASGSCQGLFNNVLYEITICFSKYRVIVKYYRDHKNITTNPNVAKVSGL